MSQPAFQYNQDRASRRSPRSWWWLVGGAVAASFLMVLYAGYRLQLRPVAGQGASQRFEINFGESVPTIGDHLQTAGLIRDHNAFVAYVNLHGLRRKIEAGIYSLAPTESTQTIAGLLSSGKTLTDRLVVPEGYTIAQIEQAAKAFGIKPADFDAALAAPHANLFLATHPAGVNYEGYLFPDSYQITPKTTAAQLVQTMLDTFGTQVDQSYLQAFAAEGLTLHQGLTLASIIEKEVSTPADRPIVAQIFLSRLRQGIMLGSDVTAVYASKLAGVPFNVNLNSPYNTRVVRGLPPGPICNPGLAALNAAAHPASTNYLYFLAGKDGKIHYATTYAQHQANIQKYLN